MTNELTIAITNNSLSNVRTAVDTKADVNFKNGVPLILAAKHGNVEIVNFLIENGARVNARHSQALNTAAIYGSYEIIYILIEAGAHASALRLSTLNNMTKLALDDWKWLEEQQAYANLSLRYILQFAAKNNNFELIRYLIWKGAKDKYGIALYLAAQHGCIDAIRLLVKCQPRRWLVSGKRLNNALFLAATYGHKDVVKFLVGMGADITKPTYESAIETAAYHGHLSILKHFFSDSVTSDMVDQAMRGSKSGHQLDVIGYLMLRFVRMSLNEHAKNMNKN